MIYVYYIGIDCNINDILDDIRVVYEVLVIEYEI